MKKAKGEKEEKNWYRLDLSAIVFPTLQRQDFSSVYRLSALLKEDVVPDKLQLALDRVLPRFPSYKVAIRTGVFWRYLETNKRPGPFVQEDIKNPCMPMPFRANNRYLVRLYYYGKRVSLEVHHSLGDGTGGMYLLHTLLAEYLRLQGHPITLGQMVKDINEKPDPEETEDAYIRYANAEVRPDRPKEKAYLIRGTAEPFYTLNMIIGILSAREVYQVAKHYNASVTEYLNSVMLYALLQKQEQEKPKKKRPIAIAMPVNLRRFFPTKSLRNFISMVYPGIDPRLGTYTFEEIVTQVHHYMRYYINNKFLRGDITTNAATQQNPLIRIIPLFIKDRVVRQFYKMVQDKSSTVGLTNMGVLQVPENMIPWIERFDICMGQPFSRRTNCSIVTYQDQMTITFASSIYESDVERLFFTKLVKDGIHVKLESNR
ncbi:MAG TPA: alcohol acetyltransferase [Lachnospiraceae bacterium]|nr:alcohol acetyltransferase [Lachnospiraceae bacterium]